MTIRRFSVAVIVLGALLASVGTIQADESFTRRSLNGTNAFSGAGTFGGLPADLSSRKKDYLKAAGYGRKRAR